MDATVMELVLDANPLVAAAIAFAAGAIPFASPDVCRWCRATCRMGLLVAGLGVMLATERGPGEWRLTSRAPAGGVATAPLLGFVFGVG